MVKHRVVVKVFRHGEVILVSVLATCHGILQRLLPVSPSFWAKLTFSYNNCELLCYFIVDQVPKSDIVDEVVSSKGDNL